MLRALVALLALLQLAQGMRVDPERIWARLRLEAEAEAEAQGHQGIAPFSGRNRRQLGGQGPKEETIQVTAPLFSSRLFEFGPQAGDKEMTGGLDLAKRLPLSRPLLFYGQQHPALWILSNGGIGFEQSARQYRANMLPSQVKLVAPFWNRNDLRNGGKVYFREVAGGRVLERGQSEIRYQYDLEVKVHSAVLVTFEKMQPVASQPLPDENTNTFQMALFLTSNGTFANFIYSNIGWTQGAEAGFNAGDGTNFFALPTSGTGNIMYLEDYGNTGIPGEWMFILGPERIQRCKAGIKGDTCDEACSAGEWGPDCVRCCHCAEGGCNETSGECKVAGCAQCWTGPACQQRESRCANQRQCGQNAVQKTEHNRCGEPQQRCECLPGYQGDPHTECADIDECARPGTCHPRAQCTNTPGRFFCQCQDGAMSDGISECVASFLYPFEQSHRLPNDRHGRVEWQLKHPLRIFGRDRASLWLTSNGLILVKGAKNVPAKSGERHKLDGMDVQGVAPFFAPIDLAQQGQIFVEETTDPRILAKAERLVNEQLLGGGQQQQQLTGEQFTASHALLVTYANVSLSGSSSRGGTRPLNTFQTLLVGGREGGQKRAEAVTFVEFLYRDIQWSEDAEAGIMAPDKANSIALPGSGTEGIEQLSQLSNVRSQGVWLYRIDGTAPSACIQPDLQPPYCDARSPALVNQQPSAPRSPPPSSSVAPPVSKTKTPTTTMPSSTSTSSSVPPPPPPPPPSNTKEAVSASSSPERAFGLEGSEEGEEEVEQQEVRPSLPQFPQVEQSGWMPVGAGHQKGSSRKESPQLASKKPAIVQIQSREFEEMPPDAFDDGTVSRATTKSPEDEEKRDDDDQVREIVPSLIAPSLIKPQVPPPPSNRNVSPPSFVQSPVVEESRPNKIETSLELPKQKPPPPQLRIEQAPALTPAPTRSSISRTTTISAAESESTTAELEGKKDSSAQSVEADRQPPPIQTIGTEQFGDELGRDNLHGVATSSLSPAPIPKEEPTGNGLQQESATPPPPPPEQTPMSSSTEASSSRFFVFNTTKPRPAVQSTKKLVVQQQKEASTSPPKLKPSNPDGDDPILMDWDREENPLDGGMAQGSKLSIVVPIAIVLVWLVVLVVVAVFLCCRRRQTQERLRTLYGPAYQIRPVYTMRVNKMGPNGGGFGALAATEGSYEEHLEKAAQRLSAELAYNPNPLLAGPGRYSLYGSYWNISPEGSRQNGAPSATHKQHQQRPMPAGGHGPMEISSPRSQESGSGKPASGHHQGGGGSSVFSNYVQQLANGHRNGVAGADRDEFFNGQQRSSGQRFSGGRH